MDLNEYQNEARQTAIYPGKDGFRNGDLSGITYTILGLIGEAGELLYSFSESEVGDNMWYISQMTWELLAPLTHLEQIKPYDYSYTESVLMLGNVYKKVFRDDNSIITNKRRKEILKLLSTALHHLMNTPDFEKILVDNIYKLRERKKNGSLMGDGDVR